MLKLQLFCKTSISASFDKLRSQICEGRIVCTLNNRIKFSASSKVYLWTTQDNATKKHNRVQMSQRIWTAGCLT